MLFSFSRIYFQGKVSSTLYPKPVIFYNVCPNLNSILSQLSISVPAGLGMSYYLYVIRCHRNVLSFKLLRLLTKSLVLLNLNYCLPVWDTSLRIHSLQRLKRMQNRAVRL